MINHAPEKWSGKRGSNPQLSAWEADALPLNYSRSDKPIKGGTTAFIIPYQVNIAIGKMTKRSEACRCYDDVRQNVKKE